MLTVVHSDLTYKLGIKDFCVRLLRPNDVMKITLIERLSVSLYVYFIIFTFLVHKFKSSKIGLDDPMVNIRILCT